VKKSRGQGVAASPRDEEKIGFFRFRFSVLSLQNVSPHVIFFFVFHCSVAFIGEVWLGQNHNGPSTFPFLFFSFFFVNFDIFCTFLKRAISKSTQQEKSVIVKLTR
jgi:hypothetical protein